MSWFTYTLYGAYCKNTESTLKKLILKNEDVLYWNLSRKVGGTVQGIEATQV